MIDTFLDFGGRRACRRSCRPRPPNAGSPAWPWSPSYHGHRVDLNTLRRRHPVSLKGATLRGLIQVANQMHLAAGRFASSWTICVDLTPAGDRALGHEPLRRPQGGHRARAIVIHDPAFGVQIYSLEEASKHLTGVALELSPAAGFTPQE